MHGSVGELPQFAHTFSEKNLFGTYWKSSYLVVVCENKLARAFTKCTTSCDKRLTRLISYIHHTSDNGQYYNVGNTAQQCRLGLFRDFDFARELEHSKSTSGGILCIFGSQTFVSTS